MKTEKTLSVLDCEMCIAVPGHGNMIDVINPVTGLTWYFGKTLEDVRKEPEYTEAELMRVEDFCKSKAERQDTPVIWDETTEERYTDGLEVLPPAIWLGSDFMVGEACDHHATTGQPRYQAFRMQDEKYYVASRPMTRAEFKAAREVRI